MGRVLVTGATGFVGLEVARQLCKKGVRPRLLVRRPLRGALLASLGAELMQGDLESPESLARAVQGMDTVIHLGARAIFEEYSLVRPTIVGGSVALMRACAAAGVRRFVYASSLLVYQGQEAVVDQRTSAFTRHGYGRAKIEAERALSEIADQTGIDLAVL
ncbi:MAG TPA: NAD(P)H-binding protein, partial [Vicinamibacterales bacterium]|nr:NAD(P)H-binding protein [Vicinamibacterales bacterium]